MNLIYLGQNDEDANEDKPKRPYLQNMAKLVLEIVTIPASSSANTAVKIDKWYMWQI